MNANAGGVGRLSKHRTGRWWARMGGGSLAEASYSSARRMQGLASSLTGLGREMAEEGRRVLAASTQIARQSNAQNDRLHGSQHLIGDIRRSASESGQTSEQLRVRVTGARGALETLTRFLGDRTRMIHGLTASVSQSSARFAEVGESVGEVERLLGQIAELGDQTDLLALNAAIEASRAGEHGAGFQVVAREMRTVADRTISATEQIRRVIDGMRGSTATASEAMATALEASNRNAEFGPATAEAVQACLQSLGEAEQMTESVAAATQRQICAASELEERWVAVDKNARECTHDADAAAERSMRTLSLAVRFHEHLRELGELQGNADAADRAFWERQGCDLATQDAACRRSAGVEQLTGIKPELQESLAALERECQRVGPASRRVTSRSGVSTWELCFGNRSVTDRTEQVDAVSTPSGIAATLFVLTEETDRRKVFVRVATSVKRASGERATGTPLNPNGTVAPLLLAGEQAYGFVYILGVPHIGSYAPILDGAGRCIGASYVGRPVAIE